MSAVFSKMMTRVAPNNNDDDDDDGFIRVVSKWRPSSLAPITVIMTHADETSLIIPEKKSYKNYKNKNYYDLLRDAAADRDDDDADEDVDDEPMGVAFLSLKNATMEKTSRKGQFEAANDWSVVDEEKREGPVDSNKNAKIQKIHCVSVAAVVEKDSLLIANAAALIHDAVKTAVPIETVKDVPVKIDLSKDETSNVRFMDEDKVAASSPISFSTRLMIPTANDNDRINRGDPKISVASPSEDTLLNFQDEVPLKDLVAMKKKSEHDSVALKSLEPLFVYFKMVCESQLRYSGFRCGKGGSVAHRRPFFSARLRASLKEKEKEANRVVEHVNHTIAVNNDDDDDALKKNPLVVIASTNVTRTNEHNVEPLYSNKALATFLKTLLEPLFGYYCYDGGSSTANNPQMITDDFSNSKHDPETSKLQQLFSAVFSFSGTGLLLGRHQDSYYYDTNKNDDACSKAKSRTSTNQNVTRPSNRLTSTKGGFRCPRFLVILMISTFLLFAVTHAANPTKRPTKRPIKPTQKPSKKPTKKPSARKVPTKKPTKKPSNRKPSFRPTKRPTIGATKKRTPKPTVKPTKKPTIKPFSNEPRW